MIRRLSFFIILMALPVCACAQGEGRWEGRSFRGSRDEFTSGGSATAFRHMLSSELKNVPTLEPRMKDMLQIQHEKFALKRKRAVYATGHDDQPSDVVLKEFHNILRQEDELTSREQTIISDVKQNAEKIQEEISRRREQLAGELDRMPERKLNKSEIEPAEMAVERRRVQRLIRFYEFLGEQIANVKTRQDGNDWIRKISRDAWPPEELDPHAVEQTQRKLQQLMQEQQEIRRRMQSIDDRIQELRDVLDSAPPRQGPQENRRPGGGMGHREAGPRGRPEAVTPPQR